MFLITKSRTQQRYLRLQQDLAQMERLHQSVPVTVRFVADGRDPSAPDLYLVEINIRSITKVTDLGRPIWVDKVKMEISLPGDYPTNQNPEITIDTPLFHPHFSVKKRLLGMEYGLWVDPNPSEREKGLGNLVLWVLRSLRFEADYIVTTAGKRIANKKALEWYIYWAANFNKGIKPWFPSDKTNLPSPFSDDFSRKFDVEPKKFSVDETEGNAVEKNFTLAPRKSFKIIETTPPCRPTLASAPEPQKFLASNFRDGSKSHRLYIESKAVEKIFNHISWATNTNTNKVEQGGILLGRAFKDESKNVMFGIVEDAVPGESAVGTSASLEMDHGTWKKMIDQVDNMLDAATENGLQIIGWYHTHPNQLDVFMSGTDQGTQSRFFANDWQFAIVINPHRKIWRAFHGKRSEECQGFMLEK